MSVTPPWQKVVGERLLKATSKSVPKPKAVSTKAEFEVVDQSGCQDEVQLRSTAPRFENHRRLSSKHDRMEAAREIPTNIEKRARHLSSGASKANHSPKARECEESVAICEDSVGNPRTLSWWISRSWKLPPSRLNGWVVSWMLEEYSNEEQVATACDLKMFENRVLDAGMGSILDKRANPRARCAAISRASEVGNDLLDENAQRAMLRAIGKSLRSYSSGIKCWAAFCDCMGIQQHFPATQEMVLKYLGIFSRYETCQQYIKHLKWAHNFLRMECSWQGAVHAQAMRGLKKGAIPPKAKPALHARMVSEMIKTAMGEGSLEVAALMAIARHFLLRVPSEAIPLEWEGSHSSVTIRDSTATITLTTRKNVVVPSVLERDCCCATSGRRLCSVHWLMTLKAQSQGQARVFTIGEAEFRRKVESIAVIVGASTGSRVGTHAFRRGMAQDIIDAGGSLAVLLRAGDWKSRAFLSYLRESQPQEAAVSQAVINFSDSEAEPDM